MDHASKQLKSQPEGTESTCPGLRGMTRGFGEGNGDYALLVVDASSEAKVRARLAADPWTGRILTIASVKPWSVWLRAPVRP